MEAVASYCVPYSGREIPPGSFNIEFPVPSPVRPCILLSLSVNKVTVFTLALA